MCLRDSLYLISKLGLEGNHICRIFAREGGIGALIRLLEKKNSNSKESPQVKLAANENSDLDCGGGKDEAGIVLRALGTICCVEESIEELQARQ